MKKGENRTNVNRNIK